MKPPRQDEEFEPERVSVQLKSPQLSKTVMVPDVGFGPDAAVTVTSTVALLP